jgi:hypothetical protein
VWTLRHREERAETFYGAWEILFTLAPYVPHILHFLEDAVSSGTFGEGQFICYYHHPYRRVVPIQENSLMEVQQGQNRNTSAFSATGHAREIVDYTWRVLWTTGLVMGVALGIFIGHGRPEIGDRTINYFVIRLHIFYR